MFQFFCNLSTAVFLGRWVDLDKNVYIDNFISYLKHLPIFGMFNNSTEAFYDSLGNVQVAENLFLPQEWLTISTILATICCITLFWIIVKAVIKLCTFWK
ncbi:MAG: hypothetical protein MJ214_05565 [Bacilli bacterium]|nr:hypothetical protein [Bacilli bacterium]